MPQEISFEQWKQQVTEGVLAAGFTPDFEEELLFMAYDMEEISVTEAVAEYIKSYQRIADNR